MLAFFFVYFARSWCEKYMLLDKKEYYSYLVLARFSAVVSKNASRKMAVFMYCIASSNSLYIEAAQVEIQGENGGWYLHGDWINSGFM
jgi:hypothetical protein